MPTSKRGGHRPGAGQPPKYGVRMTERFPLTMTEGDRAEIEAAVPEGEAISRWIVEAALMRARIEPIRLNPNTSCKNCGHVYAYHRRSGTLIADPQPESWLCAYPAHQDGSPCGCQAFTELESEPLGDNLVGKT